MGAETARAFQTTRAKLFLAVRHFEKRQKVVGLILSDDESNKAEITMIKMAFDLLDSVRTGAKEIFSKTDRLNILVNNAGWRNCHARRPHKGRIRNAVRHEPYPRFLLFQLLKPTLLKSSSRLFQSCVICVASTVHRQGPIRLMTTTLTTHHHTTHGKRTARQRRSTSTWPTKSRDGTASKACMTSRSIRATLDRTCKSTSKILWGPCGISRKSR